MSKKSKFLCKQDVIISSLSKYYLNQVDKIDLIKSIAVKSSSSVSNRRISLRVIEWFVTNYAKKYGIYWEQVYMMDNKEHTRQFNVFLSYKSQLNAYSKKQFDPFCRRKRIKFKYNDDGDIIETTIGQLNFFKWAIDNDIIKYVEENYEVINKDMVETQDTNNSRTNTQDKRKKRNELSKSASRNLKILPRKHILTFD